MMVPGIYVLDWSGQKMRSCPRWSSVSGSDLCLSLCYSFWAVFFVMR